MGAKYAECLKSHSHLGGKIDGCQEYLKDFMTEPFCKACGISTGRWFSLSSARKYLDFINQALRWKSTYIGHVDNRIKSLNNKLDFINTQISLGHHDDNTLQNETVVRNEINRLMRYKDNYWK
ncbi:hypothetical protein Salat_2606400 [Sesamum alatum]|uniref:ZF-HD dimerization-type domain-containing protein n=1 Tax=Sesamum alatum TaxID=300844 RepID=A0AAE2CAG3_9LAMI|nr:hypothetical protein Salat_2606400 [Sesamum alatum]